MAARGEHALDPGLGRKAPLGGRLGQKAGGNHHRGVSGSRAAGDGRDGDGSVAELVGRAVRAGDLDDLGEVVVAVGGSGSAEALAQAGGLKTVVRAGGAGKTGAYVRQVEVEDLGVGALGTIRDALDAEELAGERDLGRVAADQGQVVERDVVCREQGAGRTVLGRHVGDAGTLGGGQGRHAGAEGLDEAADDTLGAQQLRDRQGDVHARGVARQLAGQAQADDLRDEHGDGLAEGGSLGLDAADAPAEHAKAVGRRRVGVGADECVEAGGLEVGGLIRKGVDGRDVAEALDVELVADAAAGRHDANVVERVARPLEEGEALAVAFGLDATVLAGGGLAAHTVGGD